MGGTMVDSRAGSIVWVQRKNGTWWPGRVLSPTEISASGLLPPCDSSSTFPIKLLGRYDATLDWYNLEKSNRIKAFRCGEFDDCIRKAESSLAFTSTKHLKYTHREDAILHALELEKQEQHKKLPELVSGSKGGDTRGGSVHRAKRSRCVYSPIKSISLSEQSVHSQSSKVFPTPNPAVGNTSSKSVQSGSSKSASRSPRRKRERTASYNALRLTNKKFKVTSCPAVKKCKHKVQLHNQHSGSRSVVPTDESTVLGHNGDTVLDCCPVYQEGFGTLAWDVNQTSQPSAGNSLSEDTNIQSLSSEFTTGKNSIETLIDVHLTVQASYKGEHIPLVSLMSRLNGKAMIGHPINVEVLDENSEIHLVRKESSGQKNRSRMPQLVWKTSKRTPVRYTATLSSSATKDETVQQTSKVVGKARGNGHLKTESRRKLSKKTKMSNNKSITLHPSRGPSGTDDAGDIDSTIQNAVKDGLFYGNGGLPSVTCVPVKDIFMKLLGALGKV